MKKEKNKNGVLQKTSRYLLAHKLSLDMILYFLKLKKVSDDVQNELDQIFQNVGQDIYIEILFLLCGIVINDAEQAQRLTDEIVIHMGRMQSTLDRKIGLKVAALDYITNIKNFSYEPQMLEESTAQHMATQLILDPLTSAHGRFLIENDLQTERERFQRYGYPFSMIFIDLDDFKNINDKFGHQVGDEALIFLVDLLKRKLRKSDTVYRFGGDEFFLILRHCNLGEAKKVSTNLIQSIRKSPFDPIHKPLSVSMGMITSNRNIKDNDTLIKQVDQALYAAKESGRDKVYYWQGNDLRDLEPESDKEIKQDRAPANRNRKVVTGKVIVPGNSIGKVFLFRDLSLADLDVLEIDPSNVDIELKRISDAIEKVKEDTLKMQEVIEHDLDTEHGQIFEIQRAMLEGNSLLAEIEEELRENLLNSETTIFNVFKRKEKMLLEQDNEFMQERAFDITDIKKKVIMELKGLRKNFLSKMPPDSILVASRLLPSHTINLNKAHVRGIITEHGGPNSHSAILARAMGIPYISEPEGGIAQILNDDFVIMDSKNKQIILNPGEEEKQIIQKRMENNQSRLSELIREMATYQASYNNQHIRIFANLSSRSSAEKAVEYACDGIGLLRLENIYLSTDHIPEEEELFEMIDEIIQPLQDKEITIRLLDIGADKSLPYLNLPEESDSLMGLRGIRLLKYYPDLFETQFKVLLRLSERYKIKMLIPMITLPSELESVHEIVRRLQKDMKIGGGMSIGAMIETPAAFLKLDELLEYSDFISIGSNDLSQYMLAADRENAAVSELSAQGEALILELIGKILTKGRKVEKVITLCGEMASNMNLIESLLKLGLTDFSVSTRLIPFLKEKIYQLDKAQMKS